MSSQYLGEIRICAFTFAPRGWAFCNGQLLAINQNQALFSLLGTQYGGNGQTTFALPDLRGRLPLHFDGTRPVGAAGGTESVTLNAAQIPAHTHPLVVATAVATSADPTGRLLATSGASDPIYAPAMVSPLVMASDVIVPAGSSQPHANVMPSLALSFVISLQGIFPSRA